MQCNVFSSNLTDVLGVEMSVPKGRTDFSTRMVNTLSKHLSLCADEGSITSSDIQSEGEYRVSLFDSAVDATLLEYLDHVGYKVPTAQVKSVLLNFTLKPISMVEGFTNVVDPDSFLGVLVLDTIGIKSL